MFEIQRVSGVYYPSYRFAVNRFLNKTEAWSEPGKPINGQRRIRGPDKTGMTVFPKGPIMIKGAKTLDAFCNIKRLVDSFPGRPTCSACDWQIDHVVVFTDLDADIFEHKIVHPKIENVEWCLAVPGGLLFGVVPQNKKCTANQLDKQIESIVSKLEELLETLDLR
ncbi:MAG: hypothetical protein CMP20_02820 [Rickettsiales bacterium]|nr:hypothetical protein [Rickettsiales bacterium]